MENGLLLLTAGFFVYIASFVTSLIYLNKGNNLYVFHEYRFFHSYTMKNYYSISKIKNNYKIATIYCLVGATIFYIISIMVNKILGDNNPHAKIILYYIMCICSFVAGMNSLLIASGICKKLKDITDKTLDIMCSFLTIIGIIFLCICLFSFYRIIGNNSEIKVEATKTAEIVMKYDETNDVRIYEFSDGNNSESKHLIGSEIVNETPMYFYYCRDEDGALVRRNLERNERVTKIFDVLNEGEEPYLRIMNEVKITTDNSGVELNETEEILSTMYYLYVPKGTKVAEF